MKHRNYHNRSISSITHSSGCSAIGPGRKTFIFTLGLVVVFLTFSAASASPINSDVTSNASGPTNSAELEAFMDGAVNAQLNANHIPGATVAVVKDGQIIFAKGYGYADIDKRQPVVGNQTLFRVGSVSKLFVWTAVMQLAEQGKLDLDADVNTYLKDFQVPSTYSRPITLKNLMSHTSGFEDLAISGRFFVHNSTDIMPLEEYLKEGMPARVRPPGELTAYSNYGSALAAYIVEQVSGMPFDRYVEENILLPLDMNNTTFDQPLPARLASNMSIGYAYSNNAYTAKPFEYVQVWPAGSMSSTSEDMAKFMIAHLQNGRYGDKRILQEATAQQMHSRLFTNAPGVNGVTYGFLEINPENPRVIGHGGDTILFHTQLALIPESKLGLFISLNEEDSEFAATELLQTFMDHYYPMPPPPVPEPISGFEKNASLFAGNYRPTRNAYTNFEKLTSLSDRIRISPGPNSTLIISQITGGSKEWVEIKPLTFSPADGLPSRDGLVFGKDSQGHINYLFIKLDPTAAYEKVPWQDDLSINLFLLGSCILLFLSTLIWPISLIIRHSPREPKKPVRAARLFAGGASMINLLFLTGLKFLFQDKLANIEFIYSVSTFLILLLAIALIAAILALGSVVFAVLAWKDNYWSYPERIHYSLVVMALLAFVWWLNNWNLLGFRF
ncbi:serine hydrolase domain-containing protein [Methanosarcina sp. T3]|uniref:serine hydrolase domain-containing protein n=1 Tax=Methanosarcina sp. T3 TaxID=3439062 RepID=UPI003F85DA19